MAPDRTAVLTRDTSREAEALQVQAWRSLSTVEIAALIDGASRAMRTMALAGLRARHPDVPEHELIPRYVMLTLGREVALEVYPGVIAPDPPGR